MDFLDKITRQISTINLEPIEEAVVKACYHDDDIPKYKHMEFLIKASNQNITKNIGRLILLQTNNDKWLPVLKSLCVVHKIMCVGGDIFIKQIYNESQILTNLTLFLDTTIGPYAGVHSQFIRKYAEYLKYKARVYYLIELSIEKYKQQSIIKIIDNREIYFIMKAYKLWIEQYKKIFDCELPFADTETLHPISAYAIKLLVQDCYRLYSAINISSMYLLEQFMNLDKQTGISSVNAYKKFTSLDDKYQEWQETIKNLNIFEITSIENTPISLDTIRKLENYFLLSNT